MLSVRSSDNGKIFIDNNLVASGNYQNRLETGLHTLVVEKESHRPYKKNITVAAGKDQTLEPVYGKLNMDMEQVTLKATHDGYRDRETTHTLASGDNRLNLTIEEIQLGTLKINANGLRGASVTVDGASGTITDANGEAVIKDLPDGSAGYGLYPRTTVTR